jgi:hypothetical protein
MEAPPNADALARAKQPPLWRIALTYSVAQLLADYVASSIVLIAHIALIGRDPIALGAGALSNKLFHTVAFLAATFLVFSIQAKRWPHSYWTIAPIVAMVDCTVAFMPFFPDDPTSPPWIVGFGVRLLYSLGLMTLAGFLWRRRVRGV